MSEIIITLGAVPQSLSDELFEKLKEVDRNFREHRWEPSELNGGKLCEVAYTIVRGYVDGTYPSNSSKPANFVDACRQLEQAPQSLSRSVRIQIPRVLIALYEIRNNRGVGHVGGDVNPNHMDAICVLHMCKWIVSEIVRIFHNVSTTDAAKLVESISDRSTALIWDTGSTKRVLNNSLNMLQKTLLILHANMVPMHEKELAESIEHSNLSVYRRDILVKSHKKRLLEYNKSSRIVQISPIGIQIVEESIINSADK